MIAASSVTTPDVWVKCMTSVFCITISILASAKTRGDEFWRNRDIRVPPIDEITIISPGVNSTGKPEPFVTGEGQVEIPPAVIVHNSYYSGDRDFRGPVFPGGPCVLVVNHPKTGEKLYLDIQMLPGSPRIVYRNTYIDYHFGKQRIRVQFCSPLNVLHPHEPVVKYCHGTEYLQEPLSTDSRRAARPSWVERTGIPEVVQSASDSSKAIARQSADGIRRTGEVVTNPLKRTVQSTPLGSLLCPDPEESASRERNSQIDTATTQSPSIRTQR